MAANQSTSLPNPGFQQPFLVFPALTAEYTWRVISTETGRTISRHKLLENAVRKAEVLNIRSWTPVLPEAQYAERVPVGMRSILGSCQLWYDYSGGNANECDRPG